MNSRNRFFVLLGVLFLGALVYYYISTDHASDLVLQGTVDANQVIVSSKIAGRIEKLAVEEGQSLKAGDLIAIIDSAELSAAKEASAAQAQSLASQLGAMKATAASTTGDTASAVASAQATASAAEATLAGVAADRQKQASLTKRTVALADQGIASAQDRDDAIQSLKAAEAREKAARDQVAASEAALKAAQARTNQARAAQANVNAALGQLTSAQAQAAEASVRLGYTKIIAPVAGKVGIWAAREGEVVNPGAAIVTVVDLLNTWVYAAIPETEAGAVQLGDTLVVRMPGGERVNGQVIAKSAEGDFATQRDVSRLKRDIKTIRLKLRIDNPGERFVPGMTAEVLVPRKKLAHP